MKTTSHLTKRLLAVCCLLLLTATSGLGQENWTQLSATSRHLQDVQMLDFNTIIAVGGSRSNDAITTVIRSNDRGQNWDIIIDVPSSPWLQSVHFASTTRGFAAGYDGMVIRTDDGGQSWDTLQLPGNAALRDYNDVYFTSETVGFLVGGNQANDSIRTILKTIDGGDSWQIIKDDLGPWPKAVQFVSATVGFASGELGTILKTTDGGDTWSDISPQGNLVNRHYNDIRFADEMNGFAVGGQEKNDSIRTIIRTNDGGDTWSVLVDQADTWLNGIAFLSSNTFLAVGNDSTVISTQDGGVTWERVAISQSINWAVNLNAVDFIHPELGIVVGDYGQILLYQGEVPSLPVVSLNAPVIFSSDSIFITGTVNASGASTDVVLEYGSTLSFGSTATVMPAVVSGNTDTEVEMVMTNIPSGIYFCRLRAENMAGSTLSETRQFYIGNFYDDVNLNFEQWNDMTFVLLEDWQTLGNPHQSLSYDGSTAVTISSDNTNVTGAIVLGNADEGHFTGGFPVSSTPDSVVGYFKYEITPGTEGVVFVGLKKNGIILATEVYTITGSSGGVFERLSFPVAYAGIEIPDTIILGVANNNITVEPEVESPFNVISVDNLSIISPVPTLIPNSDFERWQTVEATHPANWFSHDMQEGPMLNETVFKTQDAQHGNYALILKNSIQHNESGRLSTSNQAYDKMARFAVAGKHATLNGYYKYDMQGVMDTVDVSIRIYSNGVQVGLGQMEIGEGVSSYSPFEIEIGYHEPSLFPDSAHIQFYIGNDSLLGPSVLYLDNLSFDGFVVPSIPPLITPVEEPSSHQEFSVLVYPNPTTGNVVIEAIGYEPIDQLDVYDMTGKLIMQQHSSTHRIQLNMGSQPAGVYFLRMFSKAIGKWQTKKLILN